MKTSAENRRISQLLRGIQKGEIIPRPDFQRKLVWSKNDKAAFLETVLKGYPFPEIYIAVGEVNLETAVGTEMLVDGQQRITTLLQYFMGSEALKLPKEIQAYKLLSQEERTSFLNYDVAVRNLGIIAVEEIREVFSRINSTSYSLNAMEIHNARYRGPLKKRADIMAEDAFFDEHRVFSAQEIRRMRNVVYCLTVIISMLSTYFHRDDELEAFLERYNDDFPEDDDIRQRFESTRDFIQGCNLPERSRAWKKTDLLVLFVEIDRLLNKEKVKLNAIKVGASIEAFYEKVDLEMQIPSGDEDLQSYFKTTVQATNDRTSRVTRGRVVRKVILAT